MDSLLREGKELHSDKEVDFILSAQRVILQECIKILLKEHSLEVAFMFRILLFQYNPH